MNIFIQLMEKIIGLFKISFFIYGHAITFWDVFIWCLVATVLIGFIINLLKG